MKQFKEDLDTALAVVLYLSIGWMFDHEYFDTWKAIFNRLKGAKK